MSKEDPALWMGFRCLGVWRGGWLSIQKRHQWTLMLATVVVAREKRNAEEDARTRETHEEVEEEKEARH